MSQSQCVIDKCKRTSRALCHCCNQNICLLHLNEHNDIVISQLNPLTDEINLLDNRLMTLDVKTLVEESRQRLEQWRDECYNIIDCFFEKKCRELDQIVIDKINKQKDEISFIRAKLTKLIEEQEASHQEIDLLKTKIREFDENLNKIEHLSIQTNIHPLTIDDNIIRIDEKSDLLSTLSSPFKTIDSSAIKFTVIASNNQYLLFHQHLYLCLVDDQLQIVKKLPWNSGRIWDICWSSTLNRFIMTTENCGVCFVNENTISLENAKCLKKERFYSCTSSDTSLFLTVDSLGSAIMEYRLLPSIDFLRQWKSSDICTKDEYIYNIRYNNQTLGLIIQKFPEKILSLELRSAKTLDRLWSVQVEMGLKPYQYGYSLLNDNDWLLISKASSRILHITKDGQMKEIYDYNPKPFNATLFGHNTLAILTEKGVHFHKL